MVVGLLYHDLAESGEEEASGFPGPGAARYKLAPAEFAVHLAAVKRVIAGPAIASPDSLLSSDAGWLLTFDDGGLSALTPTADLLESHGWRGFFFVTTDRIGTPAFLSADQIRELHKRGHVIGSHSCSHPERMAYCSPEQLRDEWRRSRAALEAILGAPVVTASVPGGYHSKAVAESAADAGYRVLFNSEPTTCSHMVAGCRVVGRYTVYRGMTARSAAALVSSRLARWRQALTWNCKKLAKAVGGRAYLAVRRRLLGLRYGAPQANGGRA